MGPIRQSRCDGAQYDLPPNSEKFTDRSFPRPRANNALDLKFGNPLSPRRNATDTQSLVDNLNAKYKETHTNIIRAFHKYKAYYDRKAQASPLKVNDFVFLLNPKISTQSEKIPFNSFKWEGPYKVVKILTQSNYIVTKVGTFRTQCVHRLRLRPFVPHDQIEDIHDDAA